MSLRVNTSTGSSAILTTVSPGADFALESISLHLSAAGGAGNLTVTIDAAAGAAYDVALPTQDMTSIANLFWQPERPIELSKDDKVVVAWANASGRTYGLIVRYRGR